MVSTRDAIQAEYAGSGDAFIAVIDPSGLGLDGGLLFATYLGGSGAETAYAIAVGGSGTPDDPFSVYVVGLTSSRDFPTIAGAFQQEISEAKQKGKPGKNAPLADAFIAKIVGPFEGMELVEPLNFTPIAIDDDYATKEDIVLSILAENGLGLLANDRDPNDDTLTVSSYGSPKNGEVTVSPNGSFTYTPNANFFGTDSFTYTASDGSSKDSATARIDVASVDDPPIANDDMYFAVTEGKLIVPASDGVLANDSDPDDSLTVSGNSSPDNGTVMVNLDGSFTYTPGSFIGTASFTYQASDGSGVSDRATVTIEVTVDATGDDPPTVAVVNPKEGDYLAGTVTLQADAVDDRGIEKVEFFVDGALLGADTVGTDGWSFDWDTTTPSSEGSSEGGHTIRAKATDTGSNNTVSAEVGVTVDNVPPSVEFLNPIDATIVSGRVVVKAKATDINPITQVEFLVDGTLKLRMLGDLAEYTFEWNTFEETDGSHTLQAIATDSAGNTASIPVILVEVFNAPATDMHVRDLDGSSLTYVPSKWQAFVDVWIDDQYHETVSDATVNFDWVDSRGGTGAAACTTGTGGNCAVFRLGVPTRASSVTFTVTGVSHASLDYKAADNHDPDGDSVIEIDDTISITVLKP